MSQFSSADNPLVNFSEQCASAIEQAGSSIVAVNAGRRCGASGLYWQPGILVTIDHAIRREEDIPIVLSDGQTIAASVVGRDSSTDLAVLQLPNQEFPLLLKSSDSLKVGQFVLAAGRSSEGNLTASMGLIGRLGGKWRSWQGGKIDQLIRPHLVSTWGLTGSVLLDSQGKLIGLNTTAPRHSVLTIPVATIQRVVDQLLQTGRVARGYLGIGMQAVPIPDRLVQTLNLACSEGVMLLSVEPDSPADRGGLLIGDVLIALETQPMASVDDVRLMLDTDRMGQTLIASVIRGGTLVELSVTVGER